MKLILQIVAVILILSGAVFLLQGVNILPGSYMSGDPQWAINGSVMIVVGAGLFYFAIRRK